MALSALFSFYRSVLFATKQKYVDLSAREGTGSTGLQPILEYSVSERTSGWTCRLARKKILPVGSVRYAPYRSAHVSPFRNRMPLFFLFLFLFCGVLVLGRFLLLRFVLFLLPFGVAHDQAPFSFGPLRCMLSRSRLLYRSVLGLQTDQQRRAFLS